MALIYSLVRWIFYQLPTVSNLFVALLSLPVIFMSETLKRLEDKKSARRWAALCLAIIGVGAVVSDKVQQANEQWKTSGEQAILQKKIDDLGGNLQAEELQHASEVRYLEGKIDAFSEFGPAILKLAQVSEENSRKEYEQKSFTNTELRTFVEQVVKKMRDWESRRDQAERQAEDNYMTAASQVADPRSPEGQQKLSQLFNSNAIQIGQISATFDNEFRENILGDAIIAKDQLISKLGIGAQPEVTSLDKPGQYVFEGIIVGPYPVTAAANYLERFASKLSP